MSAIVYLIPCIPALDIFQYTPSHNRQDISDFYKRNLELNSRSGVAIFSELHRECARLCPEVQQPASPQPCSTHHLCVVHEDSEIPIQVVKKSVIRLLQTVRACFKELFPRKDFLPGTYTADMDLSLIHI